MNVNKWTLGLASLGVISLASVGHAEEMLSPVLTKVSSTTLSGYVDTTATWKFGTGDLAMPGRVYDGGAGTYNHDGFNLNVVSLTLDKPLDEDQWSAGYHVQTLIGPGAAKRGTRSLIGGGAGDIGLNEAYVALRVPVGNGIDLKVGQFGTYNGYEAYDTYKNPNWSRSYGFFIESSAHVGVSASYQINDNVSVMAGVGNTAGYNNQIDASQTIESRKAYLAMISLTAPESFGFLQGATLSLGYTGGDAAQGLYTPGSQIQQNYYIGASVPLPVTGLSLGLAWDYTTGQGYKLANGDKDWAQAIAVYMSYQATEKFKLNGRLDYAKGTDTGAFGAFGYTTAATDDRNELFSFTVTADYSLWKNVISRAEFRWDHALEGTPFGGTATKPTSDENALSVTANIIYLF
jgi:hypothetical protein